MSKLALTNKLVTDISALTFSGGSSLFGKVKKIFDETMQSNDALIFPSSTSVTPDGSSNDYVDYTYTLFTVELIEDASQAVLESKMDRLASVEDELLDYLRKLPNNLEGDISGLDIINISNINTTYSVVKTDNGIGLELEFNFTVNTVSNPRII